MLDSVDKSQETNGIHFSLENARAIFLQKAADCNLSPNALYSNQEEFHRMSESDMSEYLTRAKAKLSSSLEAVRQSFLPRENVGQQSIDNSGNSESSTDSNIVYNITDLVPISQARSLEIENKHLFCEPSSKSHELLSTKDRHERNVQACLQPKNQNSDAKLQVWKERATAAERHVQQLLMVLSEQNNTHISEIKVWKERTRIAEEAVGRNRQCLEELAEWKAKMREADHQISQLVQLLSEQESARLSESSLEKVRQEGEQVLALEDALVDCKRSHALELSRLETDTLMAKAPRAEARNGALQPSHDPGALQEWKEQTRQAMEAAIHARDALLESEARHRRKAEEYEEKLRAAEERLGQLAKDNADVRRKLCGRADSDVRQRRAIQDALLELDRKFAQAKGQHAAISRALMQRADVCEQRLREAEAAVRVCRPARQDCGPNSRVERTEPEMHSPGKVRSIPEGRTEQVAAAVIAAVMDSERSHGSGSDAWRERAVREGERALSLEAALIECRRAHALEVCQLRNRLVGCGLAVSESVSQMQLSPATQTSGQLISELSDWKEKTRQAMEAAIHARDALLESEARHGREAEEYEEKLRAAEARLGQMAEEQGRCCLALDEARLRATKAEEVVQMLERELAHAQNGRAGESAELRQRTEACERWMVDAEAAMAERDRRHAAAAAAADHVIVEARRQAMKMVNLLDVFDGELKVELNAFSDCLQFYAAAEKELEWSLLERLDSTAKQLQYLLYQVALSFGQSRLDALRRLESDEVQSLAEQMEREKQLHLKQIDTVSQRLQDIKETVTKLKSARQSAESSIANLNTSAEAEPESNASKVSFCSPWRAIRISPTSGHGLVESCCTFACLE